MILNKLWSAYRKLSHSSDETNKPGVGKKMLMVNISDKKKKTHILYSIAYFGITAVLSVFLLLLLCAAIFDFEVCFTCFPSYPEKIRNKLSYNVQLRSKYDHSIPNDLSEKSSNSIIHKPATTITSIEKNLKEQSVTNTDKNTVPENIFILKDPQIGKITETEVPHKISADIYKYDSKRNITTDIHENNKNALFRLKSIFKVPSNTFNHTLPENINNKTSIPNTNNIILPKSQAYKPAINIYPNKPTLENLPQTESSIPSFFMKLLNQSSNVNSFDDDKNVSNIDLKKQKFLISKGKDKIKAFNEKRKAFRILSNSSVNLKQLPVLSNDLENLPPSDPESKRFMRVMLNPKKEQVRFQSSLEDEVSEGKNHNQETENVYNDSNIKPLSVYRNSSLSYFLMGKEYKSFPLKDTPIQNISAINNENEDAPSVVNSWKSNEMMIFLSLLKTMFDDHLFQLTEKTVVHSDAKSTQPVNYTFKNESEFFFKTDENVSEDLNSIYYSIESSTVENLPVIQNQYKYVSSELDQLTSSDMIYMYLSETKFDEHLQDEMEKMDIDSGLKLKHAVNRAFEDESEISSTNDESVSKNFSISDHWLETSPVEDVPTIRIAYEDVPSVRNRFTSIDKIFLYILQTQFGKHQTEEKEQIEMYPSFKIMSQINTAFQNVTENPFKTGGGESENPSISYYSSESSDVESIAILKNEYEDVPYILDQWVSLFLSETKVDNHLSDEKRKRKMHSGLELPPRIRPAFQNKSVNSSETNFREGENLSNSQYPAKTENEGNIIELKPKNDLKGEENNINVINFPFSIDFTKPLSSIITEDKNSEPHNMLQTDFADMQDLNKVSEANEYLLDESVLVKDISSYYFFQFLIMNLESNKLNKENESDTDEELEKLAKENEKKFMQNSQKISAPVHEFSDDLDSEESFPPEKQNTNFNTLATFAEDIFN